MYLVCAYVCMRMREFARTQQDAILLFEATRNEITSANWPSYGKFLFLFLVVVCLFLFIKRPTILLVQVTACFLSAKEISVFHLTSSAFESFRSNLPTTD